MTLFARKFRPFDGPPTSAWTRLLVLPRYAWREVFRAKVTTGLFTASFLVPVGALTVVWLKYNAAALAKLPLPMGIPIPIDARFFGFLLLVQSYFAFALTLFVGPSVVSPDLVNGAFPLFLSRPLSRWQYVLGKLFVLGLLLSAITWAPLLLVLLLESSLNETKGLFLTRLSIAGSIVLASVLLILLLSLVSLAVSAWVKNRGIARAVLAASVFFPAGFGHALDEVLDVKWGKLLDLGSAWGRVLDGLFGIPLQTGLPLAGAWGSLLVVCAISLLLLKRKLKAHEVVR